MCLWSVLYLCHHAAVQRACLPACLPLCSRWPVQHHAFSRFIADSIESPHLVTSHVCNYTWFLYSLSHIITYYDLVFISVTESYGMFIINLRRTDFVSRSRSDCSSKWLRCKRILILLILYFVADRVSQTVKHDALMGLLTGVHLMLYKTSWPALKHGSFTVRTSVVFYSTFLRKWCLTAWTRGC
jgi:hypothetical protein